MPNLNLVIIAGHLTRDPELRFTTNGNALVQFGVGVNKEFTKNGEAKKIVTFVDCKAWSEEAKAISENFLKGDGITVTGELVTESWDDKATGAKRTKTLVQVTSAAKFHKRSDGRPAAPKAEQSESAQAPSQIDNEDVPF